MNQRTAPSNIEGHILIECRVNNVKMETDNHGMSLDGLSPPY